ncbi:MAG TPA: TonB-dependent receptor [Azospira sp.]|nr:TonB-dependent receptor [Azospira sp.]
MHPQLSRTALAVAVLSATTTTYAEDSRNADTAPVVVTATRQAQRANELLTDVTVIEQQQIQEAGQAGLGEFLASQPGIEFSSQGAPGSLTSLYIRGTNSNHTLVLVDGMRLQSITTGATALSQIPLSQIERIEILRGPASALYGSEAIGGVIQIFTKKGSDKTELEASTGFGTWNTQRTTAAVSGTAANWRYSLNAGSERSNGFNSIKDASASAYNPDRDGARNDNLTANLSYRFNHDHEAGINLFRVQAENHFDGNLPAASFDFRTQTRLQGTNLYLRDRFTQAWTSTLRFAQTEDDQQSVESATVSRRHHTTQDQWQWQNDIALPVGKLLAAAETVNQKLASSDNYTAKTRRIDSLVLGWTGNLGNHRLQFNTRQDRNSQFGSKASRLLAYGYQVNDGWRLQASLGTAFKAPSFNDLYYPPTIYGVGNPNLKPEQSRNGEIGIVYEQGRDRFSATYFRNRIENLIDWAPVDPADPYGAWTPTNIGRAKITGTTLAYDTALGERWSLRSNLTLSAPKNEDTGLQLNRRAKRYGSLAATYSQGAWNGGAEVRATGVRYDDPDMTYKMGGYSVVNLFADYRIDKEWQLFMRINNLFNREFLPSGDGFGKFYASPGTNAFVGIRYTLH